MELSALKFAADTTELERASTVIAGLVTGVAKLDKASRDAAQTEDILARAAKNSAKANLDNARAQDVKLKSNLAVTAEARKASELIEKKAQAELRAAIKREEIAQRALEKQQRTDAAVAAGLEKKIKATERDSAATKRNVDVLKLQSDTYEFILEGFSKGDSKVLAMAKSTGQLSDQLKQVLVDIRQFSKNTFDQTETGLDRMVKSAKEATSAQGFLNQGLNLTSKQARELSNDLDRLNIKLQHQGKTYDDIAKAQAVYTQKFVEEAAAVNRATAALDAVEKQRRDVVSATNYLTTADSKMAAALNVSNSALDRGATDSLVKYEQALRRSGISQELATTKLEKYKTQLAQVQAQEQKRAEQNLARGLTPQITDVVVSLWSGQSPLTVLLQQGGQINDMFQLSGVAAENFGKTVKESFTSMLPSILVVAKGVGGLLVDGFVSAGKAANEFIARATGVTGTLDAAYNKMSEDGPSVAAGRIRTLTTALSALTSGGIFLVIAALVALGVAFKNFLTEGAELNRNLALTGASLGLTKDAAIGLAQSLATAERPVAKTVELINELAKSGKFSADNIKLVNDAAIDLERYGKVSIADSAKEIAKLGEDPVKALIDVAQKTGFVTLETIENVKSLREQGKMADAAKLAMETWASASSKAASSIKSQMSPLEQVWDGILSKINKVIGRIQDLARGSSLSEQITDKEAQLASVKSGFFTSTFGLSPKGKKDVDRLNEEIYLLKLQLQSETAITEERKKRSDDASRVKAEADAVKDYTSSLEKQLGKEMTLNQFVKNAMQERTKMVASSLNKNIEDVELSADTISKITKGAELEWKSLQQKPKKDPSAKQSIKDLETEIDLENEKLGLLSSFNNELDDIERRRKSTGNEDQYQKSLNALIEKQPIYISRQKEINAAHDLTNKLFGKADMLGKDYYKTLEQINAEEASGLRSPENAERARQVAFDQTQLAKENLKYTEDSTQASQKYAAEVQKSLGDNQLQNKLLDDRVALLGLTSEEARLVTREQDRKNKLLKVELDYQDEILKIKNDDKLDPFDREKAILDAMRVRTEEEKTINREVAVKAAEDFDAEFRKIKEGITDSIVTALFEGGKAGSKKLRDVVVNALRQKVTIVVDAFVNTAINSLIGGTGVGGGGAGGFLQTASSASNLIGMGSNAAGLIGSGVGAIFGQTAGNAALGASMGLGASSSAAAAAGAASAGGASVAGAGLGSSIGAAAPYIGLALAAVSLLKGMDKSGTPHMGAGAIYSSSGGLQTGSSIYNKPTFGMGVAEEYNSKTQEGVSTLAKSLVQTFDGIATTFGKTAGYEIATAFAADNVDGAWGSLRISQDAKDILNWASDPKRDGIPKEFSSGEAGYTEYLAAIAKDTRQVLLDMDLPSWADTILESVGEAGTLEQLSTAVGEIAKIQAAFVKLGSIFDNFAGMTDKAFEAVIKASGGVDALLTNLAGYYDNFYTQQERTAKATENLTKEFDKLGIKMPEISNSTRDWYRSEVERLGALDLSIEANAKAYASVLSLQGAVSELAPTFDDVKNSVDEVGKELNAFLEGILKTTSDLEIELLQAQGRESEALAQRRKVETEGYNAVELAAYDYNLRLKESITATNAASNALKAYKNAANSISTSKDTINGIVRTPAEQADSAISKALANLNTLLKPASTVTSAGRSYLGDYADVFAAFLKDTAKGAMFEGLSRDAYAQLHYENFGKNEGRKDPLDLKAMVITLASTFKSLSLNDVLGIDTSNQGLYSAEQWDAIAEVFAAKANSVTVTKEDNKVPDAVIETQLDLVKVLQDYNRALLEAQGNTSGLAAFDKAITDAALLAEGWTQIQIDAVDAARELTKIANATQEFNRALLEAQGDNAGLAAFDKAISDAALLTQGWTQLQIDTVDAARNSKQAMEDQKNNLQIAFDALSKSVDAEKSVIQKQIDIYSKSVNTLSELFNTLSSSVKELYGTVDSTTAMQYNQGRDFIRTSAVNAATTGVLPVNAELQDALNAVKSGNVLFATKFEKDFAALTLASDLSLMEKLSKTQLTEAERMLKTNQDQLETLDNILIEAQKQLSTAQAQLDATAVLNASILSVSAALATFTSAVTTALSSIGGTKPAVTPVTPAGGGNALDGNKAAVAALQDDRYNSIANSILQGTWTSFGPGDPSYNAFVSDPRFPGFDVGINNVPYDMTARIHKGEAIVPEKFNPFNPNARMNISGDDSALLQELKSLRTEVQMLRVEARATAISTSKINNNLERSIVPTQDGDALLVKTTT